MLRFGFRSRGGSRHGFKHGHGFGSASASGDQAALCRDSANLLKNAVTQHSPVVHLFVTNAEYTFYIKSVKHVCIQLIVISALVEAPERLCSLRKLLEGRSGCFSKVGGHICFSLHFAKSCEGQS